MLRSCLRTIFEKSSSPTFIRRSATLLLATAFALSTQSSTYQIKTFENVLNILPRDAVPFDPAEFSANNQDNYYQAAFPTALQNFRSVCPGLPRTIDTSAEASNWFYSNFKQYSFETTPLPFRDASYGLVVTFDRHDEKNAVLTDLNRALPDSELLMNYLEHKRIEISERLRHDPEILRLATNWNKIDDISVKRAALERISHITLDTLLPNKDISYPELIWNTKDLGPQSFAEYRNGDNEIHINGQLAPTNFTFEFASDITIHETVHAFQSILVNWGMHGYLRNMHDVDRYARLLYSNKMEGLGAMRMDIERPETSFQYLLTKTESMSWGFSVISDTIRNPNLVSTLHNTLERDMYTAFDARAPRLRERQTALLEKPLSRMDNSADAGTLPEACLPH